MIKAEESSTTHRRERSKQMYEEAAEVMPGGVTANIKYFGPHPIMMEQGHGSKLYDVDGNEYIDFLLCYGALMTGHGHPSVYTAVTEQMYSKGTTIFGTPHQLEIDMAKKLIDLYPGIEQVRYCNSGMESTLLAVRLAAAYTGKPKLAKFEGHYHGGYDQVLMSVNPDESKAGSAEEPVAVPDSSGIPEKDLDNTVVLPFNNIEAAEKRLRAHADELSAVIMEPIQAGFIPAEKDFIERLRELTKELGILLIFDEVKTGFRVALGGAQEIYGIQPDLTTLGKVLGGGFPVGVLGGKKHIMELCSPKAGRDILTAGSGQEKKPDPFFHSGTYNGHPTTLAAGLATIELLEEEGRMESIFTRTTKLRQDLEDLYHSWGVPMQAMGWGSIFNIVLTEEPVRNMRDMKKADTDLRRRIDEALLEFGIYSKPMNRYSLSTAHTDEDVDKTVRAHEKALKRVLGE